MANNKILKLIVIIFAFIIGLGVILAMIMGYFVPSPQTSDVEVVSNKISNQASNVNAKSVLDKKTEQSEKLQNETNALLSLFDKKMQIVSVFIKDEPILKSGTEAQQRVAYTICENKTNPTIFVKKVFYQDVNKKQLINILKHELTHAYFCRQGIQAGHDERFRKKFESVGGFGN
jgi:beta-lactamase regulating signal transducer with metallopeptidase domain